LFVLYLLALVAAHIAADWRLMRSLRAFVLSIVPFGFLWVERELRREVAPRSEPAS
jgi:integral membrane protein